MSYSLHLGDCLTVMATLEANSIDSIVTDPPAGISFMSKKWDSDKGGRKQWIAWMTEVAAESLRVIRPGGHAFVWALPKTAHWTTTAWEDAGWEIREKFYHLFGQGFPKSLNVSRALLELPWCLCGHVASAGTKDAGVMDKALAASGTSLELGSSIEFARSQFGGGKVALAGTELAAIGNEGNAAARADVRVALGSGGGDTFSAIEGPTLPPQDISARVRTGDTPGLTRGLTTNDAERNGGGLKSGSSAGHRFSTVEGRGENIVGQLAPVMLRSFDVAGMAASNEIADNISGIQDEPEALRDNMMGNQVSDTTAVNTSPIPSDNSLRDVVPSASLIRPLATAPGGISGSGSATLVVDSHALATAIDRGFDSFSDTLVEGVSAHDASEGLRAASEFTTSGSLEQNSLGGITASRGAVFGSPIATGELDSAVLASFGKHSPIIRQLVTERKVSVCAECGRPMRPEWVIDGLGTATKPAVEEWILLRKPLSEPNISSNVLAWGTGGINVDACRIGIDQDDDIHRKHAKSHRSGNNSCFAGLGESDYHVPQGRWPANLCLDETFVLIQVLKYNTPSEIKQVIQEYYHDYELPNMRQRNQSSAKQSQAEQGPILQSGMLRDGTVEANDGRGALHVREDSYRGIEGEDSTDAGSTPRKVSDGEVQYVEGRDAFVERLLDDLPGHLDAGGTLPLWQYGEERRQSLHTRASASDGALLGAALDDERGSTSSKRSQERQPSGELGVARQCYAQNGTQSHSEGIAKSEIGKRATESASLRVAEDHIPTQWLKYFEPSGESIRGGAAALLDEMSGTLTSNGGKGPHRIQATQKRNERRSAYGDYGASNDAVYGDTGGASRFFLRVAHDTEDEPLRFGYFSKASKRDRDEGLEGMPEREGGAYANGKGMPGRTLINGEWIQTGTWEEPNRLSRKNGHPTVKPTSLMRWLVRLVTPPGGVVLDPFAGSGSTLKAAILEGFGCVGIELDPEYLAIAQARCAHAECGMTDKGTPSYPSDLPLLQTQNIGMGVHGEPKC